VLTEKSDPERLSVTEKRDPETPTTSNLADGEPVPTPTFPAVEPDTTKRVEPRLFSTSKTGPDWFGAPPLTSIVWSVVVEEPDTVRRDPAVMVPMPTLPEATM